MDITSAKAAAALLAKHWKEGTTLAMVIPTNEELVIAQDALRLTA